ncbi:MAG TPA: efflux RND transporter periplasmic adaptor subunit [Bryobacteraceae bacterium]|jgi:cobalt-zinc-cadmium efflux system membrane fusion protein|nr:efflux RND transporter periplasmic adaptor subunit [Bryobacteraceae bacterium]
MNQFRALVPFVALLAILTSCAAPKETKATASNESQAAPQPGLFTVPSEQLAHLRIVPVATSNWAIAIHTTGTVDFDADHTTQAITQVNGPISRILVDTGAQVKAGEALLYVSSPDVANAISAYRKARNQQQLAQLTLNRTQVLLDRGAVAQKDLEAAQATFNDSATDVQNSLQALRIFGVTKQEIDQAERQNVAITPELAVYAPIAGIVVQKLVSPGQLIQAGATTCFMISDVSTVWVQGHIFDRDLPSVRLGDTVEESNPAFAQKFHGVLSYIGSMVDAATRTTPVRIVTQNPAGLLKKDSFIDAVIHTRTQKNVLTVPVSAVLHNEQNEPFVYLEMQPGKFAQRLITVGAQQNDQQEILSGLKPGDNVVSEGSVFLQFANSYQ